MKQKVMKVKFEIVVATECYVSPNLSITERKEKRFLNVWEAQAYYNEKSKQDCEYHATTAYLAIIQNK